MRLKKRYSYTWRNKKAGHNGKWAKYLFLLPGLSGISFFVLIPFCDVVRRSFFTTLSGEFVGLKNYLAVFDNSAFHLAASNTIKFVAVCLPLLLILSLLLALLINGNSVMEKCKVLYLLPMAMPAATVVLVWKLLFYKQGFLNSWLGTHVDFMAQKTSFWVLAASYVWKNLGYTLVLWLAGLKAIPTDILEAARVDGAGKLQCFFKVVLPNLTGVMYTITVLSFLNSFKIFREAYLVSGAYPEDEIYLLQHLFNNWYTYLELDKMAAGAVLTAFVLGSIAMVLQRLWDRE